MNSVGALSLLLVGDRDGIEVELVGGKKGKNCKSQGLVTVTVYTSSGIVAKKTSNVDYKNHLLIREE